MRPDDKSHIERLMIAKKILNCLKGQNTLIVLTDLAKNAGFTNARNEDFQAGFKYLIDNEIVNLRQSGWRSEKRGGKVHPKTVVLLRDIYVLDDDKEIIIEDGFSRRIFWLKRAIVRGLRRK